MPETRKIIVRNRPAGFCESYRDGLHVEFVEEKPQKPPAPAPKESPEEIILPIPLIA